MKKIKIEKSPIPIIWLDTLAIIEIYKTKIGKSSDNRVQKLYDLIKMKVVERKLICPLGDHEEEIEEDLKDVINNILGLTLGIRFKANEDIQQTQVFKAIKLYETNEIPILTYKDAIYKDPLEEIKTTSPFIISVVVNSTSEEISRRKHTKKLNLDELQSAKENYYIDKDFHKQLEDELMGHYSATRYVYETLMYKSRNKVPFTEREFNQINNMLALPLTYWKRYKSNGLTGYLEFLKSVEYKNLPFVDINARMTADLFISKRKLIDSGDPTDISNISTLLPFCNYVLTDKDQMNRIKRLNIDKKYDTYVYSMSNIDELFDKLETL
ncbi:hypothetical protein M5X11_04390 [Paenibacillus alginolyticus]|uniref:hypothetical protein n=1 Tax=Paenibacillus alginolyticus TaxID=59839 RepID=UPI00040E6A01|nr:hypothetical protein [Paenibacillus alginolyticus]MCY9664216.1 hypothetical protein [Paenibacillus alginolyticus]